MAVPSFVDRVVLDVAAGDGGAGCASVHREKFKPLGGPDGGDGGRGGDIVLVVDASTTTLLDLHRRPHLRAENGAQGRGGDQDGSSGSDLQVRVPDGTVVTGPDGTVLADLVGAGTRYVLAAGGHGGLGNARLASKRRRAPGFALLGEPGDAMLATLVLKTVADIGLVGYPSAGKSSLIAALSAARPKIADYPFTTLHPNLGVVRVAPEQSFVVADIPGLIQGASEGAGLGHLFLRHLQRTHLLLHLVDFAPFDDDVDPVEQAKAIVAELKKYDAALHDKPRWLVLNKIDMVPEEERAARVKEFVRRFRWKGPVFEISALTHEGSEPLIRAVYQHVAALKNVVPDDPDPRFDEASPHASTDIA